jgi:glucose-6-phosphate isomerase
MLQTTQVSSALELTEGFGLAPENVFGFWDWVGGRVSVSSAVGALPMALHYGYEAVRGFHEGLREVDRHVLTAPFRKNLPVILGMLGVWNATYRVPSPLAQPDTYFVS